MKVTVYTTPTCGWCQQAKKFLAQKGIEYVEQDISRNRSAAEEMIRLTGQTGVPVIVVDGQVVIGFDRARLEALLTRSDGGKRPHFGLKVADAGKMAQKTGALPVFGALVGAVAPGSPGHRAGIQKGDIITELNLRRINNAADLEKAIGGLAPGSRASISLLRGQRTLRLEAEV